jgi:hypothetical protein
MHAQPVFLPREVWQVSRRLDRGRGRRQAAPWPGMAPEPLLLPRIRTAPPQPQTTAAVAGAVGRSGRGNDQPPAAGGRDSESGVAREESAARDWTREPWWRRPSVVFAEDTPVRAHEAGNVANDPLRMLHSSCGVRARA